MSATVGQPARILYLAEVGTVERVDGERALVSWPDGGITWHEVMPLRDDMFTRLITDQGRVAIVHS